MIPVAKLFMIEEGILANVRAWAYGSFGRRKEPLNRVARPSSASDNKVITTERVYNNLTPKPTPKEPSGLGFKPRYFKGSL